MMFHQPRPLHAVSVTSPHSMTSPHSPHVPHPLRASPARSPPTMCEHGRPYVTDPATGHPMCLCQLGAHGPAHGLSAHPALRGVATLPSDLRPGGFPDMRAYHSPLAPVSPLSEQNLLPPHIAFHPYGAMYAGLDAMGHPMRKAATRETTGPLKAWLGEHKKNPYPTKAEKIMLAIITRMTLTQVSTWFANARRRLKKDNRLVGEDGTDDISVDGTEDSDKEGDDNISVDVTLDGRDGGPQEMRGNVKLSSEGEVESFSDISEDENDVFRPEARLRVITSCGNNLQHVTSGLPTISPSRLSTSVTSVTSATSPGATSSSHPSPAHSPVTSASSPAPYMSSPIKTQISSSLASVETKSDKPKPKIWSISSILS